MTSKSRKSSSDGISNGPMGNCRRLRGPSANAVPSTRKTKKKSRAEGAAGACLSTCAFSRAIALCTVWSAWLPATWMLQQFQEARFVNGCIVKFSKVDLSQMTDPSSDFPTANQSRVRSLRRSLQPRRGDQSLIALDEAGDVSIEFARYRSRPKSKPKPKPKRGLGTALHAALPRTWLQGDEKPSPGGTADDVYG